MRRASGARGAARIACAACAAIVTPPPPPYELRVEPPDGDAYTTRSVPARVAGIGHTRYYCAYTLPAGVITKPTISTPPDAPEGR